jgi:hypothetical protein
MANSSISHSRLSTLDFERSQENSLRQDYRNHSAQSDGAPTPDSEERVIRTLDAVSDLGPKIRAAADGREGTESEFGGLLGHAGFYLTRVTQTAGILSIAARIAPRTSRRRRTKSRATCVEQHARCLPSYLKISKNEDLLAERLGFELKGDFLNRQ